MTDRIKPERPMALRSVAAIVLLTYSFAAATMPAAAQDSPAAPAVEAPAPTADTVVATVGGETITEADIAFAAEDLQQDLAQMPPEERRAFLVTVLLDMKVMAKAARDQKMDQTETFKRRLQYLEERALRRAYFAETIAAGVTAETVQKAYDEFVANFKPQEEVHARHILVATKEDADAIKAELAAGKPFEQLASEKSTDPSAAQNGGDLGFFSRGMMVKPFEDAVFSMKPHEIRGPVESDFGYHIIRLDGVQPAKIAPLNEVRAEVVDELRKQQAQKAFADRADTFGNLVYENANSLQPAAAAAKLGVKQSDWMSAKTAPAPFNNATLSAALFSPDAIKSKQNTDAIEVQPGVLVAARVIDHRPARLRPLAEVSAAIEARLHAEQSAKLVAKKGEAVIQALTKGEETGLNWSAFKVVGRQPFAELDAAGVKAVFRANTDKLPAYTGFARPDGSYRIVRVSRVIEPAAPDARLLGSIASGVTQAQQRADMKAMLALITAGQKVTIKPDAIDGR